MEQKNNELYDLSSVVANISKVKQLKAAKQKKPSVSVRALKFAESPDDTPLKAEIIRQINSRNLKYSDIYEYCTKIKDGDIDAGQKLGYNIIYGLTHRHSMIDSTLTLLADFLGLDILFVKRQDVESVDEDEDEEEA